MKQISSAILLLTISLGAGVARADLPRLSPPPTVFTITEISEHEQAMQSKRNRLLVGIAGGSVLALVATGITLMAVGFSDSGSSKLTSAGVGFLSAATLGVFTGLELYAW